MPEQGRLSALSESPGAAFSLKGEVMSNYSSMLRDPRWQRKRLEIMQRDNFTCIACGDKKSPLTVHHKEYAKTLWNVPDEELQTLCKFCHEALGKHPKGGIWWTGCFNGGQGVGYSYSHCPMCGNDKNFKDKGSYDKCIDCGHRIVVDRWPEKIKEASNV